MRACDDEAERVATTDEMEDSICETRASSEAGRRAPKELEIAEKVLFSMTLGRMPTNWGEAEFSKPTPFPKVKRNLPVEGSYLE